MIHALGLNQPLEKIFTAAVAGCSVLSVSSTHPSNVHIKAAIITYIALEAMDAFVIPWMFQNPDRVSDFLVTKKAASMISLIHIMLLTSPHLSTPLKAVVFLGCAYKIAQIFRQAHIEIRERGNPDFLVGALFGVLSTTNLYALAYSTVLASEAE